MELSGELTGLGDLLLESFRHGLILSCFAGTVRAETGIFPAGKGGHRARRRPAHAQSAAEFQPVFLSSALGWNMVGRISSEAKVSDRPRKVIYVFSRRKMTA